MLVSVNATSLCLASTQASRHAVQKLAPTAAVEGQLVDTNALDVVVRPGAVRVQDELVGQILGIILLHAWGCASRGMLGVRRREG